MFDCWLQILWQCILWWLVANFLTNQLALVHWLTDSIATHTRHRKNNRSNKNFHINRQHTDWSATARVNTSKIIFTNQLFRTSASLEQSARQDITQTRIHWYLDPLVLGSIGTRIHHCFCDSPVLTLESSVCHQRRCQNITQAQWCGLSTRIHWCAVISCAQCADQSLTDKECMIQAGWKA